MELNKLMKDCLIDANNEYPDCDYADTVIKAFGKYVNIVGSPVEFVDEDEAEEYFKNCVFFVVDCVLWNMLDKGVIEIEGMEDDEFVYKMSAEF